MDHLSKSLQYKEQYINIKKTMYNNHQNNQLDYKSSVSEEGGFIKLLKEKYPEEYEELFVIKHYDKIFSPKQYYKIFSPKQYEKLSVIKKHNSNSIVGGGKNIESWNQIINNFENKLATNRGLSVKISSMSSSWHERTELSRYGGIIFWHKNLSGAINPSKSIYSIYVLIQDTNNWTADNFNDQGRGRVHDYLYEQVVDKSIHTSIPSEFACASGFSMMFDVTIQRWVIKFSSIWLNSNSVFNGIIACGNNNSKMVNEGEAYMIIEAVKAWLYHGPGAVLKVSTIYEQWRSTAQLVDNLFYML